MMKKISKLFLFLILTIIIIAIYLIIFGISTEKFNNKIEEKFSKINKNISLDLKSVKFLLDPINFTLSVKTSSPKIYVNNNELKLKSFETNVSLESLIKNEFSLDHLHIITESNKLNDIISLGRSFKNSPELFVLDNIIKDGSLVGNININFDANGQIKDDYEINGFIKDGKLGQLKKFNFENLNLFFNIKNKEYTIKDVNTDYNNIKLSSSLIEIKEKKDFFQISGKLSSDEKTLDADLLSKFTDIDFKKLDIRDVNVSSKNDFSFNLNKKFKVDNFNLQSKINLIKAHYNPTIPNLKKYIPNFKDSIEFTKHEILFNYNNDKIEIQGKGNITIEDKLDVVDYKIIKKNNEYVFITSLNIDENLLLIDELQYKKKENTSSLIKLNGIYKKDKSISFSTISLKENNNKFLIKNLELNNEFKISNIASLTFEYLNSNKIKNDLNLKKNKNNYEIKGTSFDATKFIDGLLNDDNSDEKDSIFKNLNSDIDIKIEKTYLDADTFINNLKGKIYFKKNKINTLNLDASFPNRKKITLSVNTNKDDEKITTFFSGYPKPIVKQYKFIKGFDEGVLDFYSIKKKETSNSVLKIDNFKIKEVPVFAKLLSLASLQGIADLMTGEGIRFTDFEMKFSNEKELMTIEEIYAIGPAVSIMMDGYIESKKLISLRGTLVPATTINRSIASIPLIGNILVGKKTGEGVFGVSFKIKGPPEDLKTTVNPVKSLTPRFITRTLEKIKKN